MVNKDKLKKISKNLTSDGNNYMSAFKKNIDMIIDNKCISLKDLAEISDVPYKTLTNFLYGNSKDCNLSTVVKLAKAIGISVDELIGAETIDKTSRESLAICRNLPENAVYLIRWYIRYIESLNKNNEPNKRYVSVMELECNHNGNLKLTSNYKHIDITHVNEEYRYKVFFGIKIPCDHYMPVYSPYDTLLIANDRLPNANEHCLIRISNCLYIGKRKLENGIANYCSIRDGKFRISESEIQELVGYVVGFLNPDGSWGIR